MPPMPWPNAAAMTDEDLKAVFAYLKSIKPIQNDVPEPKVPPAAIDQFAQSNQALVAAMSAKPAAKPSAAKPAAAKPDAAKPAQ